MVQYFTRRFYAPFLASAWGEAAHGTFGAHIINDGTDLDQSVTGELVFKMRTWSATEPVGSWTVPFHSPPGSARQVMNSTFDAMLHRGNCPGGDASLCFLTYTAYRGNASHGLALSSNYLLLAPFYDVSTMVKPNLRVTSVMPAQQHPSAEAWESAFDVEITSDGTAAYVWAETKFAGRWSDNALMITADMPTATITFFADTLSSTENVTSDKLKASLAGDLGLWSLADTSSEYTGG